MKNWNLELWLAALALQLPPGVVSADDITPAVGSLTVQWTLSGRRDPIDCSALGLPTFDLSLSSSSLADNDWEAPCDAFEISRDLPPGSYTGEAVLVDRFDRPVTLAVPVDSIEIMAGRNVVKSVDFPVASFLFAEEGLSEADWTLTDE